MVLGKSRSDNPSPRMRRNQGDQQDSSRECNARRASAHTATPARTKGRKSFDMENHARLNSVTAKTSKTSRNDDRPLTFDDFYRQYSRNNARYSAKEASKGRRGKKIAVGILCSLLAMLVSGGIAFGAFASKVNQELVGSKTAEEQDAIQGALADRANSTDPFYMLLLGSDEREDDAEMGARSDTAIVARIDPQNNQVTLVSIPRDTKIVYKGSTIKFNAAYFYGGTAGSITAASDLLGVPISHYAEVSFSSLVDLVDAVGGVEVDVPARINDPDAGSVVIEKGIQTLNGEAALVFARSRAYTDGDFTRASNQRLLIEALANKVLSLPVDQIPSAVQESAKCVTTDLSLTGILSLAMEFVDDDGELTLYSVMTPSTFDPAEGSTYVLAERDGLRKMMEIVEQGGDPNSVKTYGATGSTLESSQ